MTYAQIQFVNTATRLRKPTRYQRWTNTHASHAMQPRHAQPPELGDGARATDRRHEPLVEVAERLARQPATSSRMLRATGARLLHRDRADAGQRRRARPSGVNDAMSPMTNSSGCPGTAQSGPTMTRPARVERHAQRRRQRARTHARAPQHGAGVARVSPPTARRDASIASTRTPVRTSTPSSSSCARARSDSGGSNGVRMRSAISTSTTRTALRSSRLKSTATMSRDRSAIAPASSTPVGPPPTTTNVSSRCRSAGIGRALRRLPAPSARAAGPPARRRGP